MSGAIPPLPQYASMDNFTSYFLYLSEDLISVYERFAIVLQTYELHFKVIFIVTYILLQVYINNLFIHSDWTIGILGFDSQRGL
jgi:hypothetical protein